MKEKLLHPLDLSRVKLEGGVIRDRVHNNYLNRLHSEGYQELKVPFLENQHLTFYGEYGAKYLCAYASAWRYSGDETVRAHMIDMKDTILQNQKEDGYLGTESLEEDRWHNWNVWNYKYILLGLLTYIDMTGDASVMPALEKGAKLCASAFLAPDGPDIISTPWEGYTGASIMEPMALLYRRTGDEIYLDFCRYILRRLEEDHQLLTKLGSDDLACNLEPRKAYELTTTMEGILEVYRCTGDEKLLACVKNYWDTVRDSQISITGSGSQFELWQFDPDIPYQDGAGKNAMENCVTNYWIRLSRQLYWETGEAKYAQAFNRSVFNSLFAEQRPDGGDACYYQALSGTKRFGVDCPFPFHWAHCCHSSSTRTLSELPSFMFAQNDSQIDSVLFGSMTAQFQVGDVPVTIEESTEYPAKGRVEYTFTCGKPVEFTFRALVPDCCRAAFFTVGGETVGANPGQFVQVTRMFQTGDKAVLTFDMPVSLIYGRGESENRVAVKYGPLILAVDSRFGADPDNAVLSIPMGSMPVLTPKAFPDENPVVVLFETDAFANGAPVKLPLVDFIHAGSYDETTFRVWLPYKVV